jgi:hypothetical protein
MDSMVSAALGKKEETEIAVAPFAYNPPGVGYESNPSFGSTRSPVLARPRPAWYHPG